MRYKKGAASFKQLLRAASGGQKAGMYRLYSGVRRRFCSVSHCGRFAVRWRKIFAGETKAGVNRVQDSAVVIRGKGNITGSSCFSVSLPGFFCDVKCYTHVHRAAAENLVGIRNDHSDSGLEQSILCVSKKSQTIRARKEKKTFS